MSFRAWTSLHLFLWAPKYTFFSAYVLRVYFFKRLNQLCTILLGGHLYQQYIVDYFGKAKSVCREHLRHNQVSLFAAGYTFFVRQAGWS